MTEPALGARGTDVAHPAGMRGWTAWIVAASVVVAGCAADDERTTAARPEFRVQAEQASRDEGRRASRRKPSVEANETEGRPDEGVAVDPTACRIRVRGRVVDEQGFAVTGAECAVVRRPTPWRIYVPPGGDSGCRAHADDQGRIDWTDPFDLLGDADDPFRIVVRARGFAVVVGAWRIVAAEIDLGTITLARADRVEGVIQDETGAPAANVGVEIAPDADESAEEEAWRLARRDVATDASGRFAFDELAHGRYRIHVGVPDSPPAVVVSSGTRDVVLVVPRAALPRRVAANVLALGPDGAPFEGRGNAVLRFDDGQTVTSLENGRCSLHVDATCRASLLVADRETDEQFVIDAVATRDEPYVVQFGRSPTIRGRVVADPGARPIDERELRVAADPDPPGSGERRSAPVQDDGTFAVAVPNEGRYLLVAYGNLGNDPNVCRWARTGEDVEIRLPAPSSLEALNLKLHLPEDRVATDFCVRAIDSSREYDVTDCEPRGPSIVGLPPGRTWRLTVRVKAGDDWFGPTTLDGLRTGGPPIDVALAPSPTIDGVVVRRDGTPVVRAKVRASSVVDPRVADATTGLDGRFRLVGLARGEWTLAAETDALETSPRVVVDAGSRDVRVVATPRRAPF